LGDALTPEEWATYLLDGLRAASVVLASGATEVRTSRESIHIPRLTDDGGASWYDELEPIGDGNPEGDSLLLRPRKCAALTTISNEVIDDSDPSAIDAIGTAMVRAVALTVDAAFLGGAGAKDPLGLLRLTGLPGATGSVDFDGLVTGAGAIRAAGGTPDVVYMSPADLTQLQLAKDANDRPLIWPDATAAIGNTIAGLRVFPTPALPAGTALIAEAAQIVVAVRRDATVAVSEDAIFAQDGALVRVVMRADIGVADINGLYRLGAAPAATKSSKTAA